MDLHHHAPLALSHDSLARRLDPRAKLIAALWVLLALALTPATGTGWVLVFSVAWLALAELCLLGAWTALARAAVVLPFVLLPLLLAPLAGEQDGRAVVLRAAALGLKSWLSALVVVLLASTTPFPGLCAALEKLGAPSILGSTLLLTERYVSVLRAEIAAMWTAARLRGFRPGAGRSWRVFGQMLGALLLRGLDRAERVHAAMRARGFQGRVVVLTRWGFGRAEGALLLGALAWGAGLLWMTRAAL